MIIPENGSVIAVWFSCGAASAIATYRILQKYRDTCTIRVLNNPVIEEHEDNQRFLKDIEQWLGIKVETVINESHKHCSAEEIWEQRRYMAGIAGAPCTMLLKQEARRKWEMNNDYDYHVLGYTYEEKHRYERFLKQRPNTIGILIDEKITKKDCYTILENNNIELPEIYKLGYPNANCIGCVKASSAPYWNHVRNMHPEIFKKRCELSRELGAKLVKINDERIFLDELPNDIKEKNLNGLDFECGIFCGMDDNNE